MSVTRILGAALASVMVLALTACPATPLDPTASFTVNPPSGDTATVFAFDARGSTTPAETTITNYLWDFGDGRTATNDATTTHQYGAPGTYTVRLTVINDRGLADTTTQEVTVSAPPIVTALVGHVTNATAGEAVAGSTVEVYQAGTETLVISVTTDANGSFRLELAPGRYDLRLDKDGFAGSQVLNARVIEGRENRLHIVQMEAFNPGWPTVPPTVEIGKVADGNIYDGTQGFIPYSVTSTPADEALGTRFIYVALDRMPGAAFTTLLRDVFVQVDETGDRLIDPQDYAAQGETTFEAVVYDTNNNRTHVIRHIEVVHLFASPIDPLDAPRMASVLAVTASQQIRFFGIEPQAAPAGGNLYVDLFWFDNFGPDFDAENYGYAYGYNVYRSVSGGEFERIATSPANFHRDISPELRVGQTVCYRVTGFVGSYQSPPSNELCTTPLGPWSVRLVSPADDAQGVGLTPTFEWEATNAVGVHHHYIPVLWDFLTGTTGLFISPDEFALVDRTSYTWNEGGQYNGTPFATLAKGTTYEWQMFAAYATDHPTNPTAVSIAVDAFGLFSPPFWSTTDVFTFTTTP